MRTSESHHPGSLGGRPCSQYTTNLPGASIGKPELHPSAGPGTKPREPGASRMRTSLEPRASGQWNGARSPAAIGVPSAPPGAAGVHCSYSSGKSASFVNQKRCVNVTTLMRSAPAGYSSVPMLTPRSYAPARKERSAGPPICGVISSEKGGDQPSSARAPPARGVCAACRVMASETTRTAISCLWPRLTEYRSVWSSCATSSPSSSAPPRSDAPSASRLAARPSDCAPSLASDAPSRPPSVVSFLPTLNCSVSPVPFFSQCVAYTCIRCGEKAHVERCCTSSRSAFSPLCSAGFSLCASNRSATSSGCTSIGGPQSYPASRSCTATRAPHASPCSSATWLGSSSPSDGPGWRELPAAAVRYSSA